ncbi:MAG TPA: hypothetical protein VH298_05940, partial [Jatrophihabitans sp.]|nr:hypothetical protein [Jatrophihabitans sp.]
AGYPELEQLGSVLSDGLLDGEIIVLRDGRPSFEALAERVHINDRGRALELVERLPVSVMAFDLLRLAGTDLIHQPWSQRRVALEGLELADGWRCSPIYTDGPALQAATVDQGLEGVVAKRVTASYQPGRRSPDWIKTANQKHQACLVGGWRQQQGTSAVRIGGLLVGVPATGPDGRPELRFAGRVGSGIAGASERELRRLLEPLRRDDSPFADQLPAVDANGAVWCDPQVVVEVRYLTWTGRMRQPVFRGIRPDVPASEVRDER